jgi:hypothetical protein
MSGISADAIRYSISSDGVAAVQSCDDCVSILLPRNSVPFDGALVRVRVLRAIDVPDSVNIVLIPYSIHHMNSDVFRFRSCLKSVAFELSSELYLIVPSAFQQCPLQSIFIPQSIDFIGSKAFEGCESIACVSFDRHSSLWQLKSANFFGLSNLRAITIPASIRQIHRTAFDFCDNLLLVRFDSPSQCWYITLEAFSQCPRLQWFFLPPSVEVIDSNGISLSSPLLHFFPSDRSHFCVRNDCLVGIDDHKLIAYLGDSPTFCFDADVSIVSDGIFSGNDQLQNVVFDPDSRLQRLPAFAFYGSRLLSITVPKNVLFIGETCFAECGELALASFEFPARIRRIDSEAFYGCSSLTSFTVHSSVSTLGKAVFMYCKKLISVTFDPPSHLTDISDGVFQFCPRLTNLRLPDSVVTIAVSAFTDTNIPSLTGRGISTTDSLRSPEDNCALFGKTEEHCYPFDCSRDWGKCLLLCFFPRGLELRGRR